ncbi:hypothetical protein FHT86_000977 [Rhizobium sp. BK313]|nr:hypothetical protein [Rhizobium sp. BK313]
MARGMFEKPIHLSERNCKPGRGARPEFFSQVVPFFPASDSNFFDLLRALGELELPEDCHAAAA